MQPKSLVVFHAMGLRIQECDAKWTDSWMPGRPRGHTQLGYLLAVGA